MPEKTPKKPKAAELGMDVEKVRARSRSFPLPLALTHKRRLERYCRITSKAAEANFSLETAAELAGVKWSTVLQYLGDREFVEMWASEKKIRLPEKLFGKAVGMALGEVIQTPDGEIQRPADGAMIRHLQNALDPNFQKKTTVEHTGSVDVHVSAALKEMSDEEKRAELRRLLGPEPMTIEDGEIVGD